MKQLMKRIQDLLKELHPLPQNALILRMPVIEANEGELRKVLATINQDPADNAIFPFSVFSNIHFARFLLLEGPVLDGRKQSETYATTLIFIANIDGSKTDFIDELVKHVSQGLDQVLSACHGYPLKSKRTRASRKSFISEHIIPSQTDYVNTIGRSASMIRQESELRDALKLFLNGIKPDSFRSATALRDEVIKFVSSNPEISWALASRAQPSFLWRSIENIRFAGITALGMLILLWAWPILAVWVLALRMRESRDSEDTHRPPLERLNQLRSTEDIAAHNPFAAVGYVKSGWLRHTTTQTLLVAAQGVLRHVFNKGNLAGIPVLGLDGVDTIHFAHWIMLDDGQRLLFTSNYDGSLESYMVDFIDKVAWGLNLIFSNGEGYPLTRWIVHDGAKKEQNFKDYLGNHQIENQVWFTAYPRLTAVNIANNEAIHDGLYGHMTEAQARAWLKRL